MKFNQLSILAVLSLSLVFTSCERDEIMPVKGTTPLPTTPPGNGTTPPPTPTPPPPATPPGGGSTPTTPTLPPPVTVNSLLAQFQNKQFEYDAQNRLIKVIYPDQSYLGFSITYQGSKISRVDINTGNWIIYTYDGDKVVETHRYYGENLVNYHTKYEYEGDRVSRKTVMSFTRSNEGQLGVTTYKYDTRGNLIEAAIRWSTNHQPENLSAPSYIYWGSYDSSPNPQPYIDGDHYLPGVKLSTNNAGYRDPGYGKELYSYIYHDSGMPMKRYTKLELYPHAASHIEPYSYK